MRAGVLELGDKLGPVPWQLPPTLRFDRDALDAFLRWLPPAAAEHNVAGVTADTAGTWPLLLDQPADFAYARLHGDTELYERLGANP